VRKVDARSDIYSLGVIFYELLTGELPFRGQTRMLLVQVMQDEPRPPRRLNDSIPRDLETICLKAMAKEPGRRYQTAGELADDLRRFLKGEPIQARPVGAWERGWRWAKRRPAVAGLLAVGVVAALALVGAIVGAAFNAQLKTALDDTKHARDAETEQRKKAEQFRYFHHIARAHASLRDGNSAEAERLLDDCPEEQRRWEWHYLKRQCHAELLTLEHTDWVWRVAFSPDGKRLASAGKDKSVKVWDVTTGKLIRTMPGHTGEVWSVVFSPDGKQLATASENGEVKIWDMLAERESRSFPVKLTDHSNLAYSPDGTLLAAVVRDSTGRIQVMVWHAMTGQETLVIPDSSGHVRTVAFSPDGKRLAWGPGDQSLVRVWDFEARRVRFTFTGHRDDVTGLAFSPNGERLATGGLDGTLMVWDMTVRRGGDPDSPLLTLIGHTSVVYCVAFSPDGTRIASASLDRSVRIWDAVTGQETLTLTGHADGVTDVAFSPDGTRIVSAARDKTVKIWDPTTRHAGFINKGQTEVSRLQAVTFSPNGLRLASAGLDKTVKIWDVATRQVIRTLPGHIAMVEDVKFSPDGSRLASASDDMTVRIWDAESGVPVHILAGHESFVNGIAFSADGVQISSAGADGKILIWDVSKGGQPIRAIRGHEEPVNGVVFSPDGSHIASASEDKTVRIWDSATGQLIRTLKGHASQVSCLAFNREGSRLATAGVWDKWVKIWNVEIEQEPLTLLGHTSNIKSVAFSRDGTRLASASWDHTVRIWDVSSGMEVLTLRCPTGVVSGVVFSPNGTRIAAAGSGSTPVIWDARPLSPDAPLEREAIGLLDHLLSKPLCKADVELYLRNSPTIRPEPRKLALSLIDRYREVDDPKRYHDAAWLVIRHPYSNPFQYRFALQQAETACRLAPEEAKYRIALGVAQYRNRMYEDAHVTLKKAEQVNKDMPAHLAFLTLAQHQLGKNDEAKATLARLREVMKQERWAKDADGQGFLREAEAVMAAKPTPEK
jgi:WD40 repeat protein